MSEAPPQYVLDYITRLIAGEIVLSDDPGSAIRKWREMYGLSQVDASKLMNVKPSILSDYERGRRRAGRKFVEKFVNTLFKHDSSSGWSATIRIAKLMNLYVDGVLDMGEFVQPMEVDELVTASCGLLLSSSVARRPVLGYTVLDSVRAVRALTASEYVKLMGSTSERAVIFTNITRGRSVMVAIRVSPVKPSVVLLHGIKSVDPLAVSIADLEGIPLVVTDVELSELRDRLRRRTLLWTQQLHGPAGI